MTLTRLAGLSAALVAAISLFGSAAAPASAADAPYTAYGLGQKAGAMIAASVGGKSCGPAVTADALGNWLMSIANTSLCAPKERDVVTFTVDGQPAEQTVAWSIGGAPADPAKGIALTVSATVKTATVPTPAASVGFSGGTIAPSGASILAFTGSTDQLNTAGAAVKALSVSATVNGKMLTFVVGAPSFVNTEFNAAFAGGLTGTLVIVKT